MKRCALFLVLPVLAAGLLLGCSGKGGDTGGSDKKPDVGDDFKGPSFKLAWSEYPSWSVFGVASDYRLIDGRKGKVGPLEKKWGVDIELGLLEYDPCIQLYASGQYDAVCVTNMDVLASAVTRPSVAILPTSTSVGADACLVDIKLSGIDPAEMDKALAKLRGEKVYGLANSVSQYAFERCLVKLKKDPKEYDKFTDQPPLTAATAMATKQPSHKAIMVWNPYVMTTLRDNKDARRLFDSRLIPEEIIDMVVVGADSLKKDKGPEFACCVIDTYYEVCKLLFENKDSTQADEAIQKLGEKFGKLDLETMKKCVKDPEGSKFYSSPDKGIDLFNKNEAFRKETMERVVKFCVDHEMTKKKDKDGKEVVVPAKFGFGNADKAGNVDLRFDTTYIEKVRDRK